jgi:hypothetical protein
MSLRVAATLFDRFDRMFHPEYPIEEQEFIDSVTRQSRVERTSAQTMGVAFHSAIERLHSDDARWVSDGLVTGAVPPENDGDPWSTELFDREALQAVLDTVEGHDRALAEVKVCFRTLSLDVIAVADLLAPGWYAVDWKTSTKAKNLVADYWMPSWQWRISCVALKVPKFTYVGVQVKKDNRTGIITATEVNSYTCEAYSGLEDEVLDKANQIADWLTERGIQTPDIAQIYRYGRPE